MHHAHLRNVIHLFYFQYHQFLLQLDVSIMIGCPLLLLRYKVLHYKVNQTIYMGVEDYVDINGSPRSAIKMKVWKIYKYQMVDFSYPGHACNKHVFIEGRFSKLDEQFI